MNRTLGPIMLAIVGLLMTGCIDADDAAVQADGNEAVPDRGSPADVASPGRAPAAESIDCSQGADDKEFTWTLPAQAVRESGTDTVTLPETTVRASFVRVVDAYVGAWSVTVTDPDGAVRFGHGSSGAGVGDSQVNVAPANGGTTVRNGNARGGDYEIEWSAAGLFENVGVRIVARVC